MPNKIADISTFENLQNQANQSMGFRSSLSVFNGADPKKDIENVDNKEIENAFDAKREISAVEAKLKEVWLRFEKTKQALEVYTAKLKAAKQQGYKGTAEGLFDECTRVKNWMISYAENIETMQKGVVGLPKLSEVTKKPVLPKFDFTLDGD
jgi:SMC interacting uncharacterized protein involved in chromosome segregation